MSGALTGLRVLDLSGTIAGQYCSRLFADYGAEVCLIEPGGGSATRRMGPFRPNDGEPLTFFHLNTSKRSVTAGWEPLVEQADIAIVGDAADRDRIRAANPRCIIGLVTPFGTDGPYADWQGAEIVYQALSGAMLNNGAADQPPLYGCGNRASYAAGVAAYAGILAALFERGTSGRGQDVDIAIAEVAASMSTAPTAYNYSHMPDARRGGGNSQVSCRGEWVTLWIYGHQWKDFCAALECEQLLDDPRFAGVNERQKNWAEFIAIMQAHLADWQADEVVSRLQARRLITAKASTLTALTRDDEHLKARQYWETVETPRGARTVLGPVFRMRKTPRAALRPPPAIGEAEATEIAARWSAYSSPAVKTEDGPRPSVGPLAGVRVLDMTTAWAGPMAGRVMAYLGADVIHVEHATRVDLWRHHRQAFRARLYPDGDGGERPYNRNVLFNSQNINKRSLSLDIKAPEGLALMLRLAKTCDVVLANFTPGALDRAGLGYDRLKQIRSDIIVVEMPAYGTSGPRRDAPAVGATMEMATGMASLIGYEGGPPSTTGPNYLDPIGAFNATAAIMTALCHRQRTGEGQYVEVPQIEAAMHYIGAELLAAAADNANPPRLGNTVAWAAPHDVFPAAGDDAWIAIAVTNDAEWRALCGAARLSDLGSDPKLTGVAGRIEERARIHDRIAAWTRTQSRFSAAEALQKAGVPAAPVMTPEDVASGAFYASRGMFTTLSHPEAGTHAYQGIPIHLSRTPGGDRRAAPCLGQDTRDILSSVLGMSATEIDELAQAGITSAVPV